jgi:hypothetical protein
MAADIELETKITPAQVKLVGQGSITIEPGEFLQLRHGNPASPMVDLQEQCPAGKRWIGTVDFYLTETDA